MYIHRRTILAFDDSISLEWNMFLFGIVWSDGMMKMTLLMLFYLSIKLFVFPI